MNIEHGEQEIHTEAFIRYRLFRRGRNISDRFNFFGNEFSGRI